VVCKRNGDTRERAAHGLMRALLATWSTGSPTGFERKLEINGVGYRARSRARTGALARLLHPIQFRCRRHHCDGGEERAHPGRHRQAVARLTAAKVRSFRPPEPYKARDQVRGRDDPAQGGQGRRLNPIFTELFDGWTQEDREHEGAWTDAAQARHPQARHAPPRQPRCRCFRSLKHIYAQAIDDTQNKVLASVSDARTAGRVLTGKKKKERAKRSARDRQEAVAMQIERRGFDRNGTSSMAR